MKKDPISPRSSAEDQIPFWRDSRKLGVIAQAVFLLTVSILLLYLLMNSAQGLMAVSESNFRCDDGTAAYQCFFDFWKRSSDFAIAESPISYDTNDTYFRALLVGLANTIKIAVFGIFFTAIIGVFMGIARLSSNWLLSQIAKWYIEFMRNLPLVLILIILYQVVLGEQLPAVKDASKLLGLPIYITQRGIVFPSFVTMPSFRIVAIFLLLGIFAVWGYLKYIRATEAKAGKTKRKLLPALGLFSIIALMGWFITTTLFAGQSQFVPSEGVTAETLDQLVNTHTGDEPITVCSYINERSSEVNVTSQLRQADVSYLIRQYKENKLDDIQQDLDDGTCTIFAASASLLSNNEDLQSLEPVVSIDEKPVRVDVPQLQGFNFKGGSIWTTSFLALLIGLVLYTGAFVAEIVRAGILAIPKGQSEAASALGLTESQKFRHVILPQALRIIIPPVTSQFLNLVKNSTLGIFIAFPEVFQLSSTIINQSGRSFQVVLMIMVVFLTVSLTISLFMNWFNARVSLKER